MRETSLTIAAGTPLADDVLHALRQAVIFDCGKWDPQAEDVASPAGVPLLMTGETWRDLAQLAEALDRETLAAEAELIHRPDLHRRLGLPRAIRRALRGVGPHQRPNDVRCTRYDFHLTPKGWRISEANSDVPGGFIEAGGMTRLFAEHYPGAEVAGDPASVLAQAVARAVARTPSSRRAAAGAAADTPTVALVHATAYSDDRQVMVCLAKQLEAHGLTPVLISPAQLRWRDGLARIDCDAFTGPADMLLRFYPAEWLVDLRRACGWRHWFAGSRTPLGNPATAALTQSKRLPLVWDALAAPMPTWRKLLPASFDPRQVDWRHDPRYIIKPAFGRVGEAMGFHGVTSDKAWCAIAGNVRWCPRAWVVQERFETIAVDTPQGPRFPVYGVFVIDGKAAGVYGRMAEQPVIDSKAQDVAVLVRPMASAGASAALVQGAPAEASASSGPPYAAWSEQTTRRAS